VGSVGLLVAVQVGVWGGGIGRERAVRLGGRDNEDVGLEEAQKDKCI